MKTKLLIVVVAMFVVFASCGNGAGKSCPEETEYGEPNGQEKRIALVIGNSYDTNPYFSTLLTPENDAIDIAMKLDSLGFGVRQYFNLELQEMVTAVDSFCIEAKKYDVALFFFTGNGMRLNHQDFMAANDCKIGGSYEETTNIIGVDEVMEKIEKSGCPLRIGMFDMCRTEIIKPEYHRGMNLKSLPKMANGEIRIFASKKGGIALDGKENHSPFYEAVSYVLNTCPEISLDDFEREVAEYVYDKTNGRQIVSSEKMMIGDFRFTIEKQKGN